MIKFVTKMIYYQKIIWVPGLLIKESMIFKDQKVNKK